MRSPEELIGDYRGIIIKAAMRFRRAAEFDDLYQEGMISLWSCSPDTLKLIDALHEAGNKEDASLVSTIVHRRMKRWVRYVKRLRHHNAASYEAMVEAEEDDNVYDGDSREHST